MPNKENSIRSGRALRDSKLDASLHKILSAVELTCKKCAIYEKNVAWGHPPPAILVERSRRYSLAFPPNPMRAM